MENKIFDNCIAKLQNFVQFFWNFGKNHQENREKYKKIKNSKKIIK